MAERGRVIPNGIVWHGAGMEIEEAIEWVGSPDPEDFTVGAAYDVQISDCCVTPVRFRSTVVAVDEGTVRFENGVEMDVDGWCGGIGISRVDPPTA